MKRLIIFLTIVTFLGLCTLSYAGWVRGYYRRDGTYVRGHYRSNPDGIKWNNYGRSRSTSDLYNPYGRDSDRDGLPNYMDMDDNNNGIFDDFENNNLYRW